jgi:hypothetical protein
MPTMRFRLVLQWSLTVTMRTPAVVAALFALVTSSLLAEQNDSVLKAGDMILVSITGEAAKEFSKRHSGSADNGPQADIHVQLSAHVDHVFEDGAIWIEYSLIMRDKKPVRLVTLTGKVDPKRITTDITPKGTKLYSAPGAEPRMTTEDHTNRRLELPDLKGFKVRVWHLVEEWEG